MKRTRRSDTAEKVMTKKNVVSEEYMLLLGVHSFSSFPIQKVVPNRNGDNAGNVLHLFLEAGVLFIFYIFEKMTSAHI